MPRLYDRGVTEAACMAHARRKFVDVYKSDKSPLANQALQRIAGLYAIEATIRGRTAEGRLAIRAEQSTPLFADLKRWMEQTLPRVSSKSDLAGAICYALSRWDALSLVLRDGRACIDNNAAERSMRPVAMRVSLCSTLSSIWKHWKRVGVGRATRASLSGNLTFDWFGRQVIGTDLIRCSGNNLYGRKNAAFDKAPYCMVCSA